MKSAARYCPSVMCFVSRTSIEGRWSIRLLLVFCLTCGQLLPNYGRAQETSRVMLKHQCIQVIFDDTDEDFTVFALTGANQWGSRNDGTPLFQLPSECFVRDETEDLRKTVLKGRQAENPTATTENIASDLQEYGADPQTVENAQERVQRQIDRMKGQPDQARALQRTSREEIDNPRGDYAAALLGLIAAGCMLAGGGSICAMLPAIFAPFFGAGLEVEHVKRASQIASAMSKGEPLNDDDYTFLSDGGAATWALYEQFTKQHGTGYRFQAVTGRRVPEDSTVILNMLQALAQQGQVNCDDISEVVGESSVQLTSEQRQNLLDTLFDSERARPPQRAEALRRCVERFFIQR